VPVAAAELADFGVGHAGEGVGVRIEQHLFAHTTHRFLLTAALVEPAALVGGRRGEGVASALELGERDQGRAVRAARDRLVRPAEIGELPVEPRDLVAEGAAGARLVDSRPGFAPHTGASAGQLVVDGRHVSHLSGRSD
jgi:hypothetical protein